MSNQNISYEPSDGLSYDPDEPKYWDKAGMAKEIERTFEICHGCRMCFKYCDSFPSLFSFIDDRHEGDVRKLTSVETEQVMDECFQCKLCEVNCPYTERDHHEFKLDFPKLVHRYKAIRFKEKGASIRDKMLGDPDKMGKMARILPVFVANEANKNSLSRLVMEKTVGIHREKLLPNFTGETFEKWAEKNGKISESGEAVLFQTCFVQNNEPEIGKDVLTVLEKNEVKTACTKGLNCCGMPAWEHGDITTLQKMAKRNLEILLPFVEAGSKVLAINPTCSMMLRREYPTLVAEEDRERARKVAAATMDPGEFLWSIRNEERFNTNFKSTPGAEVSYHAPCHLRASAVGFKGRDLLRKIPGVKPVTTMECCGHDGTYAMTVEGFEPSQKVGRKAFDGMKQSNDAKVWATECPLAAVQFQQFTGIKPLNPLTILARAYREDGFDEKLDGEA
ncbi:MAG: heterodisulfide reductase-related iron-sulfur binding cluster [Pyrinomonadaceae bacterium]